METIMEKPYHLCFETLSNELRIKIIELLGKTSMSVNELADKLNAERSRVSHSLSVMRGCNIVDVKKTGKKMVYSLKDRTLISSAKAGSSIFEIVDNHVDNYCTTCHKQSKPAHT